METNVSKFLKENGWVDYGKGRWVKQEWLDEPETLGIEPHLCPHWYVTLSAAEALIMHSEDMEKQEKLREQVKTLAKDVKTVKACLPEHYSVDVTQKGDIRCKSDSGISMEGDAEDPEHWDYVMKHLRQSFGERFMEVYHPVNFLHKDFIVYLRK